MREILKWVLTICLVVVGWHECYSQDAMISEVDSLRTTDTLMEMTSQSDVLESEISYMALTQYQEDYSFSSSMTPNQNGRISDAQLLKEYELKRAKKIKLTGIIGGSILGVAGITTFIICVFVTTDDEIPGFIVGGSLFAGGAAWMGYSLYKAHNLIQNVNYVSLVEHDLFSTGNSTMSASLNLINSKGLVKENALGFSLKYCF